MRKEFEMTDEQLAKLIEACKPVPYIVVGGVEPRSPFENANAAWKALGEELGCDGLTALPVSGKSNKFFTAEVKEES